MSAQVVQVFHITGTLSAREMQNGRLLKSLIYTITGNPDNEYKRQRTTLASSFEKR